MATTIFAANESQVLVNGKAIDGVRALSSPIRPTHIVRRSRWLDRSCSTRWQRC